MLIAQLKGNLQDKFVVRLSESQVDSRDSIDDRQSGGQKKVCKSLT